MTTHIVDGRTSWSYTGDIVVMGLGAAGAVAAITAHDRGAKVIVLEKQPRHHHLSTSSMSGGAFICPNDVSSAIEYMQQLCGVEKELHWTDKETLQAWAEYTSQNKQWVEELGGKVELRVKGGEHHLPGYDSIEVYNFRGRGRGLMKFLKHQIELRNIPVVYDTPAIGLLTQKTGEVVGIKALAQGGRPVNIKTAQAVVMTPGGFEFNEEMKLNYLRLYPTYFAGSSANTGDGIRMAQEIGASLWHMNCCSASWVLKLPDFAIALGPDFGGSKGFKSWIRSSVTGSPCGYIVVDKYGKRYTNENFKRHTLYYELSLYDSQKLEYPRVPSYWVFDRRRMEAGPLPLMFYGPMLYRLYRWSKDNQEEIRKGWVVQGETVGELAGHLKMDAKVLNKTVEDYNRYCEQKEDLDFHRPSQDLVPIQDPPFFAVPIWPGSANTQGGPRRNHKAQVLNTRGQPIPRLYAAGEFGSIYGMLYPGTGGNLAECFAFGRIAAENAAKESKE